MNAIELQLLIVEHNALAHARIWDPIAKQKICSGQICSSCRKPLPQPHTAECKGCESCAGRQHARMTFRRWNSLIDNNGTLPAVTAAEEASLGRTSPSPAAWCGHGCAYPPSPLPSGRHRLELPPDSRSVCP